MRKAIVTILLLVFLGGLWFAAHSWSSHLEIKHITVRGIQTIEEEEIRNLVRLPESALFREADLAAIRERVEGHPYVRRAMVNRDFPASIRVSVEERKPVALLLGSRMMLLDEDRVVLPVRNNQVPDNLAVISGSFPIPQTGDTLRHKGVERALQILRASRAADEILYHLFSEVRVFDDGSLLAYTMDGGVPVLLGSAVSARTLISLREFWLQEVVPAGADQILSIDLRFDGQIVTRWRSSVRR